MVLRDIIRMVDEIRPNAFSEKIKTVWLNEAEGLVQTDVFLLNIEEVTFYKWPENAETELLVKPPHDKLYLSYLSAMICYANGEYNRYANEMQMFNAHFGEYMRWFTETYAPADTHSDIYEDAGLGSKWQGYYISAYGIAVKHGFEGTEAEWLAELKGPPGIPGPAGKSFTILGYYMTLYALKAAVKNPEPGDAYGVGTAVPYDIYVYDEISKDWVNNGALQGPPGTPGSDGKSFTIRGYYATLSALIASVPTPEAGDAYGVGTTEPYDIYVWDEIGGMWVNNGALQGAKGDPGKAEAFTVVLPLSAWINGSQIVNDDRFTPTGSSYVVTPADDSFEDYAASTVRARNVTAEGEMEFVCGDLPEGDLTVNVLRLFSGEDPSAGEGEDSDKEDGDGFTFSMGSYKGTGEYGVYDPSELATYPENANLLSFDFIPLSVDVFGDRRCTFRLKEAGITYIQPSKKNIRPFTPYIDGTIENTWGEPQVTNYFAYGVKPVISTWVTYDADNIYYAYRAKVPNPVFGTNLKAVVFIDKANDGIVGNTHGSGPDGDMIGWWVYSNSKSGAGSWKDYSASWDGTYLKMNGRQMSTKYKIDGSFYVFEGELKIPRTSLPYVNKAIESKSEVRIPIRIGFYNNGEAYWTSTKDEAARIPAVGEVAYATPTVDGIIESSWGDPQSVTIHSGASTAPTIYTWVAVDDDNIYYAYRAEVKSVTFGTNLKALVYIDKANDGKAGWSHGSGSTGDKIGWWYYPSVGNGFWQDYSASWDGTYLKTDGRQVASTVKLVNGVYVFEGELKIPRTSAPYIDAAFKSGVEGKLPFRIEFMNGSAYATDETQVATIPACPFVRELAYEANVVRDGENGVCPLVNRLIYNKDGGAAYLVWSLESGADAELQLNKSNSIYNYTALGVDVKTLYKKMGWKGVPVE